MDEKLLLVCNRVSDLPLLEDLLKPKGFVIEKTLLLHAVEDRIQNNSFSAVIADMNFVDKKVFSWLNLLQEKKSGPFLILYGEDTSADRVSEMLQKGVYGFISRSLLSQRIYDMILEGLKNREKLFEILSMMDDLIAANKGLLQERAALKSRNEALTFIHRLSNEVAYDLNWHLILQKIFDAGFSDVLDTRFMTLFYRIGTQWNLDLYLPEKETDEKVVWEFKKEIVEKFFTLSHVSISEEEVITHLYPLEMNSAKKPSSTICDHFTFLLKSADTPLGMLTLLPGKKETVDPLKKELIATMTNILAMSLNNAKEYQNLRKMTTRDELTGALNKYGFIDCLVREFQQVRRFKKSLSLVMLDIDNFKMINDSLGHQAGDFVLKELTKCLINPLRKTDIVSRCEGDIFAIALPETEIEKAEILMKRLLKVIRSHEFIWRSKSIELQVNFGMSSTDELTQTEDQDDLIHRADDRRHRAKYSEHVLYPLAI